MFYPVPSLRRGGRFFPCWLAQAWPCRFNAVYNRRSRLFSIDVMEICEDLGEMIASESGSVVQRFSLRLSSQLLYGLILIYQRQANVFLEELLKTGGAIIAFQKKHRALPEGGRGRARVRVERDSSSDDEEGVRETRRRTRAAERSAPPLMQAEPSSITMREEILQPSAEPTVALNDGFGETAADLTHQLETMLGAEGCRAVEASLAYQTRLSDLGSAVLPHLRTEHMEVDPPELMTSLLQPFSGAGMRGEAEVSNPELHAEAPVPPPASPVRPVQVLPEPVAPPPPEPMIEELSPLEELADEQVRVRRGRARRRARPLVDADIRLNTDEIRKHLDNVRAQCRDGQDTITLSRHAPVAAEDLLRRSARGWSHQDPTMSPNLVGLFARNLFIVERAHPPRMPEALRASPPVVDAPAANGARALHESALVPPQHAAVHPAPESPPVPLGHSTPAVLAPPRVVVEDVEMNSEAPREGAIQSRERPGKLRRLDFNATNVTKTAYTTGAAIADLEGNGANTTAAAEERDSAGAQKRDSSGAQKRDSSGAQKRDSSGAQKRDSFGAQKRDSAGAQRDSAGGHVSNGAGGQDRDSAGGRGKSSVGTLDRTNGSEAQLGSLDRTPVWLSESETDSHKMMKDTWGPRATLVRIMDYEKNRRGPLTLDDLMLLGPASPPGKHRMMVACCFASLLKLKSSRFLQLVKNPVTSEIVDIQPGELINDGS